MGLAPKYWYSCPKWLTEICTFIIKCDTKLVRALSWMEGLTETGAPNPFICVRPRKGEERSRGGMGLQNAMALSPLQTWPPQPNEHETHLMWSMHSSGCIHTCAGRQAHICASIHYSVFVCLQTIINTCCVFQCICSPADAWHTCTTVFSVYLVSPEHIARSSRRFGLGWD